MNLEEIKKQAKIELARRRLFDYCQLLYPKFYLSERVFLKEFCDELQNFVENSDKRILIVNMPPRHGKSLTATRHCLREQFAIRLKQLRLVMG